MGNAVQHGSPDFPVTLTITSDTSEIAIAVHNGGTPILPADLPNIFDPPVCGSIAKPNGKTRAGSIGMGLYIAREVAKAHGGQITVTSTAGDGTTFTIRLPHTQIC